MIKAADIDTSTVGERTTTVQEFIESLECDFLGDSHRVGETARAYMVTAAGSSWILRSARRSPASTAPTGSFTS